MTLARRRLLAVAGAALLSASCSLFRSAVNTSPGIRWWLFSNFGAEKMCPEMLKRSAPLQLVPGGETLGRFFPNACRTVVNDASQTVLLEFGGTGYAWTPVAGRMGFAVTAAVEYRPDFELTDDGVYVYAQVNRVVAPPTFTIGAIENPVADWAARSPAGYAAATFGSQIVQSRLTSGFTVIRTAEGDAFALGIVRPPARPPRPYALEDEDRILYASEAVTIRPGQVDFLGPFEVADDEQALYAKLHVTGPSLDVLVLPRDQADPFREGLQRGVPLAAPSAYPLASFVAPTGQELRQRIPLPRGQYYLIVDNSNRMGQVAPPWNPMAILGGGSSTLTYSVELGEAE